MKILRCRAWIACMLLALAGCQKFGDTPMPKVSPAAETGAPAEQHGK